MVSNCREIVMNNMKTLRVGSSYHFLLSITLLVFITSSCSIEIKDVQLPTKFLSAASAYDVRGKNSVFDDKQLNFGPFATTEINRGGIQKNSSKFVLRKSRISQVVEFSMINGTGMRSNARAEGVISEEDTTILDRWLRNEWWYPDNRETKNYFAGSIEIDNGSSYEFLIPNAYDSFGRKERIVSGTLIPVDQGISQQYEIVSYQKSDKGLTVLQNTQALMFVKDDDIIGVLQEHHPEKIWISDLASVEEQFLTANVLGLLLLRHDLEDK